MKTHTTHIIKRSQSGLLLLFIIIVQNIPCLAQKEVAFTLADKERLIRLESKTEYLGKKVEDLGKKVEDLGKKVEDLGKKVEDMENRIIRVEATTQEMQKQISDLKADNNNRFNELRSDLRWMIGVFISSILIVVGFILWDRRTFLKPFESRAVEIESEVKNIRNILSAFRELARIDNKVAQVLKQHNLL